MKSMNETSTSDLRRRAVRLLRIGLAGGLIGAFLMIAPFLHMMVPFKVKWWLRRPLVWPWTAYVVLGVLSLIGVERAGGWLISWTPERLRRAVARLWERGEPWCEGVSAVVLRGLLALGLAAICGVFLLEWVPHYLTWPWWPDTEQFAIAALSWDAGRIPFRDQADFDFPGPIYVCYLTGKLFGWGKVWTYNLADVLFLVGLGGVLAYWSRRRSGSLAPGLLGFLSFLGLYCRLDYTLVAQRDWQAPCLSVMGLLWLEARPDRTGRCVSAFLTALALAFRPQVVLLLPAVPFAIDASARRPEEPWRRSLVPILEWSLFYAVGLVLAFSPLLVHGVFDDFLRRLAITRHDGSYYQTTWDASTKILFRDLANPVIRCLLPCLFIIGVRGGAEWRRTALAWLVAFLGVLLYNPISPVHHKYLDQPVVLLSSVAFAVVAGWCQSSPYIRRASLRLTGLGLLVYLSYQGVPFYCSMEASLDALGPLARGGFPAKSPPGCCKGRPFSKEISTLFVSYKWVDYVHCLEYLQRNTTRQTLVANLLGAYPYPAVNGPVGRDSPFPAAGGIFHLAHVDRGLEDEYLRALERPGDIRVVWATRPIHNPNEFRSERLRTLVRERYEPEAIFGVFEVWRQADRAPLARTPSSTPREDRP